jgi:hypothetical protein
LNKKVKKYVLHRKSKMYHNVGHYFTLAVQK